MSTLLFYYAIYAGNATNAIYYKPSVDLNIKKKQEIIGFYRNAKGIYVFNA